MMRNTSDAASLPFRDPADRVGLVAGWGSFPVEVAERCIADGKQVYIVAIKGHADPKLVELAADLRWMGVAKLGGHMRFFRQAGVHHVALAGKLFKDRLLYHGHGWIGLLPDLTSIRILGSNFITRRSDARDDTILSAVVHAYEKQGIAVLPVNEIAPKLLIPAGVLTRREPSRTQMADIQFGWRVARQMGALDIGQSITIKDQLVLGVEAIEGTDALIDRTGQLCPRGGFTLVKVAKPQQDMRFDVPTIGPRTVEQLAKAGGKVIAVEAARTILVEREATLAAAARLGICIVSLSAQEMDAQLDAYRGQAAA